MLKIIQSLSTKYLINLIIKFFNVNKPSILLYLQTKPMKLYYVMYNASKPSSTKHGEGIVGCEERFQQRRDNCDVNSKFLDEELTKQSTDLSCWPADNHSVDMNKLVSESDATDVNSNVEMLTVAKPDWQSESHAATEWENLGSEETTDIVADGKVGPVECEVKEQSTDGEMLTCVSSALGTPCTARVAASSEPSNDSSIVESVANNDVEESLLQHDSIPQDDVSSVLTGEEKIGFEPDAITASDQWPARLPAVERRVKRLQNEVPQLLFDENGSGMKRELRRSGRMLRKIRRSPLQRLRSMVSFRPSNEHPNRLSSRVREINRVVADK